MKMPERNRFITLEENETDILQRLSDDRFFSIFQQSFVYNKWVQKGNFP